MKGKLHSFGDAFFADTWNVDAVTSVVDRGASQVPSIDTVGGTRCDGCQESRGLQLGCRAVLGVCGRSQMHCSVGLPPKVLD